jgi:predicted nucleic acid-binding Zn ribbon protein
MPYRNDYTLKAALQAMLQESGLDAAYQARRVLTEWDRVAGPQVAAQTRQLRLDKGVLYLSIPHPAWRQEVNQQRLALQEAVNRYAGLPICTEVRVTA